MSPQTKRFPPNQWLQRKATIRQLYLTEKRSLDDIVRLLACDDFHPNKHQLEHKMKLWGFNKNIPKSLAEATWRYIGYEIANRKAQGEDTEVILFDQVQDKRKVEVETRRYYRFRYGDEPVPKLPQGVDILLRTPSYQELIPWPLSLPWLQFQSRYMAGLPLGISSTHTLQRHRDLSGNYMPGAMLTTRHWITKSSVSLSESNFASLLKSTMPEFYPGEATNRAKIILRGCSKKALEERIMIFLFHLSNKASRVDLNGELIIDIIERSGMMSGAITANGISSTTLLAVREMLFQLSFKVILQPQVYMIADIDAAMPRILRLIKWLLRSGQPPDTIINYNSPPINQIHVTPLQIAAWTRSNNLLAALLENGADPNLVLRRPIARRPILAVYYYEYKKWSMPPLFLAALSARQISDLGCLDLLFSFGATIYYCRSPKRGFISRFTFLTLLAGKEEEDIALDIMKALTTRPMGIAYLEAAKSSNAADIAISAASRGNLKMLEFLCDIDFDVTIANEFGLNALHAAAFEGHVKCCKFLLKRGINANHYNCKYPSPVHLACYQNHIEVVKFLHDQGACIDRELSIPPRFRELIVKRYFCQEHFYKEKGCLLREATTFLAQVQSPIKAVLCSQKKMSSLEPPFGPYARDSPAPLVSYLLHHGATIPSFAVFCAVNFRDTELLSVALAAGADPNFLGERLMTPLHLALSFKSFIPQDRSEFEVRIQIGKMLLDAGVEVTRSDAVRSMRSGDRNLVKEILGHTLLDPPKLPEWFDDLDSKMTLLEAALLSGDLCIIQQVLKRDSIKYSPGALCAATLQAVKALTDPDIVYQLLQNRDPGSASSASLLLETTAVGIAACYQSPKILERLLACLPVFNTALVPPAARFSPMRGELEACRGNEKPFWHMRSIDRCSVLIYASGDYATIMPLLLDHGYRFDWMVVVGMAYKNEEKYMKIISGQTILSHYEADSNEAIYWAIHLGNINMIKSLLQICKAVEGGKLILGRRNGPLQAAIEVGNTEMFDTLLEAGIDPAAPAEDNGGMTALQAAASYNRIGLAKRLIELKVDVNAPGARHRGRTALEGAAEHGHIDLIKLLLHSGVETNGSGQLQYLRSIGLALLNGHEVAADLIKSHRKLTEEELSILEGKHLLVETERPSYRAYSDCDFYSVSGSSSESEGRDEDGFWDLDVTIQRDGVEDESSLADRSDGMAYGDPRAVSAKSPIFSQDGNNQARQISKDETLLSYDDETNEHTLEFFSDDIQLRQEPSSVLDPVAPSEGIYDFNYLLFDIYDMGGPIGESP
ncbi:hypothetical protein F4680DRAFT_464114 [Xylaria scruposa]|nr:hypothetical protein F4680DRAFT_464114 [Xylaria scruposa]